LDWDYVGRAWYPQTGNPNGGPIACRIAAFPRREETLRVRLYQYDDFDNRKLLAEFPAPNPAPGPYPIWIAETLPSTKRDGEVAISLLDFRTGVVAPGGRRYREEPLASYAASGSGPPP